MTEEHHYFNHGDRVRFHPVIGGKHDGKAYTFEAFAGRHGSEKRLHAAIRTERGGWMLADVRALSKESDR